MQFRVGPHPCARDGGGETLEFDPARIRAGNEAGWRTVAAAWPSLDSFLAG